MTPTSRRSPRLLLLDKTPDHSNVTQRVILENTTEIYYNRDFVQKSEGVISITEITTDHVICMKFRNDAIIPARGNTAPDVTNKERHDALDHIVELRKDLLGKCRKIISEMFIKYAVDVLSWKRDDGQPLSTWQDMVTVATTKPNNEIYELKYEKNFVVGWDQREEARMMSKCHYNYRPWKEDRVLKGFIAKIFSSALNSQRKQLSSVKRRQPQIVDEMGNKNRRRGKHKIKFDGNIHTVSDSTPKKKGKITPVISTNKTNTLENKR
jgi:hypothetical protein